MTTKIDNQNLCSLLLLHVALRCSLLVRIKRETARSLPASLPFACLREQRLDSKFSCVQCWLAGWLGLCSLVYAAAELLLFPIGAGVLVGVAVGAMRQMNMYYICHRLSDGADADAFIYGKMV